MNLLKLDHIGIRVWEFSRSIRFYELLGFVVTRLDQDEGVAVMKHACGVEINFLNNSHDDCGQKNILMDVERKYPGYTHFALAVESVMQAKADLELNRIQITEGPVTFGDGKTSIFVRDPDGNVIEFTQLPQA